MVELGLGFVYVVTHNEEENLLKMDEIHDLITFRLMWSKLIFFSQTKSLDFIHKPFWSINYTNLVFHYSSEGIHCSDYVIKLNKFQGKQNIQMVCIVSKSDMDANNSNL